jgi:predicted GIY-YIG superfamily endonuclease
VGDARREEADAGWWVYMLRCADGTLYTGIARDLARRLAAHRAGTASKYTRARRPVRLVFSEPWPDRGAASRREAALKRLPRAAKRALVRAARGHGPSAPLRGATRRGRHGSARVRG